MQNPLPVDRFSAADAARRTWPQLIEAMIEAVCLVEPEGLRVVAANAEAGRLHGRPPEQLVGQDMRDLAATPEDHAFWREVGDGRWTGLWSDALVLGPDGPRPVTRRVSRVEPAPGCRLYVVAWRDRSAEVAARRAIEEQADRLAATVESLPFAVLLVDRAGRVERMNQRFAVLWSLPPGLLAVGDDDALLAHMASQVADPRGWRERLEALDALEDGETRDEVLLADGRRIERTTTPHASRGRVVGRVHVHRLLGTDPVDATGAAAPG